MLLAVDVCGDGPHYRFLQAAVRVHDQHGRDAGEVVWTPQAPATAIEPGWQDVLTLDGFLRICSASIRVSPGVL